MRGLTRTSVIACMVAGCGVVAQSLSSASYIPTADQLLALALAFLIALASTLLVSPAQHGQKKRPCESDI